MKFGTSVNRTQRQTAAPSKGQNHESKQTDCPALHGCFQPVGSCGNPVLPDRRCRMGSKRI